MEQKKKENVHKHHRQRLLENIWQVGIENIDEVKALEFILTYVVPMKDTNVLAHELLNEFGSISAVLDADYRNLMNFCNIKERTAKLLTLFPHIFARYKKDKIGKRPVLKTFGDIVDYVKALLEDKTTEELYLICLSPKGEVISSKRLASGSASHVEVSSKELTSYVLGTNATSVVMAHCHPKSTCSPSTADLATTKKVRNILDIYGIKFLDHLIVGDDGVYSFTYLKILEPRNELQ